MANVETVEGRGIPLLLDDIDTDRIIPARYLRCVTFDGLGEHAFEDDRNQNPNHPFDDPRYKGASILVAGRNFGCGSSREHAPQSLLRWGIHAVVAESFAEIFFGNCTSLGIPCVRVERAVLETLAESIKQNPKQTVVVNVRDLQVRFGEKKIPCEMSDNARQALVTGEFDSLSRLLEGVDDIQEKAAAIPYMSHFSDV
ncbi:MAG: 3-isopropylmalate dehydratase small subunit [Planctomycetota bacterium]|nr:3-isopropylmalate dehydratase small subunit [Planctomycetota bacterium]MDA1214867.1 3-isopropylmalate dehydratase small subunit [Planctomycetota bacterium]